MTRLHRSAASGRFVSAEEADADPERHVAEVVPDPLRVERMNGHFEKLHLGDGRVVHRFAAALRRGFSLAIVYFANSPPVR